MWRNAHFVFPTRRVKDLPIWEGLLVKAIILTQKSTLLLGPTHLQAQGGEARHGSQVPCDLPYPQTPFKDLISVMAKEKSHSLESRLMKYQMTEFICQGKGRGAHSVPSLPHARAVPRLWKEPSEEARCPGVTGPWGKNDPASALWRLMVGSGQAQALAEFESCYFYFWVWRQTSLHILPQAVGTVCLPSFHCGVCYLASILAKQMSNPLETNLVLSQGMSGLQPDNMLFQFYFSLNLTKFHVYLWIYGYCQIPGNLFIFKIPSCGERRVHFSRGKEMIFPIYQKYVPFYGHISDIKVQARKAGGGDLEI